MAEVDFGDSELFQQLDDSEPPVSMHIRFTDDEDEQDEAGQLRSRLEECDECIQRLTEENILSRRVLTPANTGQPLVCDQNRQPGNVCQWLAFYSVFFL